MTDRHTAAHHEKGASLARGPAWIVGSVLAVFGLLFFFEASGTPLRTGAFPQGDPGGGSFLGFEVNAWTAWLTTAAGVLVLIGSQQHLTAKATSLAVGIALAAAAGMALVAGDVLGLAAANWVDALGWGVAAGLLIVTALLPRLTHEVHDDRHARTHTDEHDRARRAGTTTGDHRDTAPGRTSTPQAPATATHGRPEGAATPVGAPTARR